jgi:hypothetical protein
MRASAVVGNDLGKALRLDLGGSDDREDLAVMSKQA